MQLEPPLSSSASLSTTLSRPLTLTPIPPARSQEDKVHHVLLYSCRNCQYQEETHNPCVYKHDLIVAAKSVPLALSLSLPSLAFEA